MFTIFNKYLKKYNTLDNSHIKKIAYAYDKDVSNNAFAINTRLFIPPDNSLRRFDLLSHNDKSFKIFFMYFLSGFFP